MWCAPSRPAPGGYITKRSAPEQLVEAINQIHGGGRYLSAEASELLALRVARGEKGHSPLESLSNRELQVLRALALGRTNREIAENYHISVKNRGHLPLPAAQEAQPAQQRGAFPLRHAARFGGVLRLPA